MENLSDHAFEFKMPADLALREVFLNWVKLIDSSIQERKDEWTEFPFIPGYKFKNVKLSDGLDIDTNVISYSIKCDSFEKTEL